MVHDRVALEGDPEKEPQRRNGLIEGRHADALGSKVQLIAAHVLSALAYHGQLKLCVARRRASCVPPFGMALRALMARFKMAAVNKV